MAILAVGRFERDTIELLRSEVAAPEDEELVEVAGREQAIEHLESGQLTSNAVVVGPRLREPLQFAQLVHRLDRELSIVVLSPPDRDSELRRALLFTPFLGHSTRCCSLTAHDRLGPELHDAVRRTRLRRSHRAAVDASRAHAATFEVPTPRPAEYLDRLLEVAPIGVFLLDREGAILAANRRAQELFESREADLRNQPIGALFPPGQRAVLCAMLDGAGSAGWAVTPTLLHRTLAGGDPQVLSVIATPLGGSAGGGPCTLSIAQDVTDRELALDELRRIRADLERRVERRTAELDRQRERAETANRAKSEFLANMSHEIRTPLNAILGLTEHLLRAELLPPHREQLGLVSEAGDSLLRLVNDILDFSKIEAGELHLQSVPFDPRALIHDTVRALEVLARQNDLRLQARAVDDGPASVPEFVLGDPGRVRQILTNLVHNAIKFTERGQVEVGVERGHVDGGEEGVHFTVRDTGIGIARGDLETIFDVFTQVDSSMTRKIGGTGLGLAICARLTDLMKGRIWAESEPGRGSTFHLLLPLTAVAAPAPGSMAPDSPTSETTRSPASRISDRSLHVLLAEDSGVNRRLATMLLEGQGHRVFPVENGREALAACRNHAFDVVLMDVQMPEMNGIEAAAAIRRMEGSSGAHVPIIALTAHAMKGDRELCLAAGMDEYLTKPIGAAELFETVERVWRELGG